MTTVLDTTWDGLAIAPDEPRGATVIVRRPVGGGEFEYLLVHRAHHGREYDGHWAWTPPAGARQPGEAVVPAALRELHEEAGITGAELYPVDLSEHWARFYTQVPADTPVELIDVEHDAYEWVGAQRAGRMCRPATVARQVPIVDTIPQVEFTFRPLARRDLPDVLAWRTAAHAAPWFREPLDLASATAKYGPRIDGSDPVRVSVILADGVACGFAQHYLIAEQPWYTGAARALGEAVGIDYLIGDPQLAWRGLGATMLWSFLRRVVRPAHPEVRMVAAGPSPDNEPSLKVLAKAGFRPAALLDGPDGPKQWCVFDTVHWLG